MQGRFELVFLLFLGIILPLAGNAQRAELTGQVIANGDVENIHVINRGSKMYTTTNAQGRFLITAKYRDTLYFTSIRYKPATIVVGYQNIQDEAITVYLEENVNVLDEVIVGKVLTGKLDSDVRNSDAERPINFYDLGLPGYTGKPLTQSQRRLAEATKAQYGVIPILPLINAISGRTKMLKERVAVERRSELIRGIRDRLGSSFFANYPLVESLRNEFWLFCSDDPHFEQRCRGRSEMMIIAFLEEKHKEFLENLESEDDD